eukprot:8842415-Pyramimonas_sp.AAC.1
MPRRVKPDLNRKHLHIHAPAETRAHFARGAAARRTTPCADATSAVPTQVPAGVKSHEMASFQENANT